MMLGIAFIAGSIILLFNILKKWHDMRNATKELENMVREAGATNVEVDYESGAIKFDSAPQFTEKKLLEFQDAVSKMGIKMNVSRVIDDTVKGDNVTYDNNEKINSLKSTEEGYVNKNNQKNLGKTDKRGTDNNQYFYEMECMDCGHKYYANGTDIWQRKCPACQGGKQ